MEVPEIDIGPLVAGRGDVQAVAGRSTPRAGRPGSSSSSATASTRTLQAALDALARDVLRPARWREGRDRDGTGGRAWRGWFPVGGELTSGVPDRKEGIYFGAELGPTIPG